MPSWRPGDTEPRPADAQAAVYVLPSSERFCTAANEHAAHKEHPAVSEDARGAIRSRPASGPAAAQKLSCRAGPCPAGAPADAPRGVQQGAGQLNGRAMMSPGRPASSMAVSPLVSFVIPHKGREEFLHDTVASNWERTDEEAEKPHGLLSSLFRRHSHRTLPKKKLTAQECFQLGFVKLYTTEDLEGAILAFARSIQVDPVFGRAYVNRALAYERLGTCSRP